jgi:hypothetical protein
MKRIGQLNGIIDGDRRYDILTLEERVTDQKELSQLKSQIRDAVGAAIEQNVAGNQPWTGHGGYYGAGRLSGLPDGAPDPWHTPDGKPYTVEPYPGIEFTIKPLPVPNVKSTPAKVPSR